tara:strand:- start:12401 stop:13627 length:1227 start_codon:yes stop_codon:yes gene_type:complete
LSIADGIQDNNREVYFSLLETVELKFIKLLLQRIRFGSLSVNFPGNVNMTFIGKESGPDAQIKIQKTRVIRRLFFSGSLGFADSYIDGDWETEDLTKLLEFAVINTSAWGRLQKGIRVIRLINKIKHFLRMNTKNGSKKNIAAHYDLGNSFYKLWLDKTMSYSSGIFDEDISDLESAQIRKHERLLGLLDTTKSKSVLEIGSGWGSFALFAASKGNHKIKGITISEEQYKESIKRLNESKMNDQVQFCLQDYRDITGSFDNIISIEMIEAVGESYWETYFKKVAEALKPGGNFVIQVITIKDDIFYDYRERVDFIQRYIFPGGMLPSRKKLIEHTRKAGFKWVNEKSFSQDYAKTLKAWSSNFELFKPEIENLGFDEKFFRCWRYYLSYCQAGFKTGHTDLLQIVLSR